MDFIPGPGQVALVEYPGNHGPLTGLITNGSQQERISIDLGAHVPPGRDLPVVVASTRPTPSTVSGPRQCRRAPTA